MGERLGPTLPDFPWDALAGYARTAAGHPDGIVDLSVGTPVDPTPEVARRALAAAADAPGYPQTAGSPEWRAAALAWLERRFGVAAAGLAVLPTVGSKELVASLPLHVGVPPGAVVAIPPLAYPTYEVGALVAGARAFPVADVTSLEPGEVALVWLNSPANPDGAVLGAEELRRVVAWARCGRTPVPVVSDECYATLDWDAPFVSLLDPRVCAGDPSGLLALHSLSKSSNLAGYRAALVAGDPDLIQRLLQFRRHAGLMMPAPVQAAMVAVLGDDEHISEQRARYERRRARLREALQAAGFRVDGSAGGLYLWASAGQDCWTSVSRLADLGILVTPGSFYGAPGSGHIRVALTATDERVAAAARRLS